MIYVVGLNQEIQNLGSAASLLMMYLMFTWATEWSVLEVDQHSTGLLKAREKQSKTTRGEDRVRKERLNCLELGMGRKLDKCSKNA
jgi:hypothetical protein